MWIVTGTALDGTSVNIRIPAAKDADKNHIIGLAFAEQAVTEGASPLNYPTLNITWSLDSIQHIPSVKLTSRTNYQLQKRVDKGLWDRYSARAFRNLDSASEALEGASAADPEAKFRVVVSITTTEIVAISKNATDVVAEEPDKPVQTETEVETPTVPKKAAPKPKA
jgi:hypothetical protein